MCGLPTETDDDVLQIGRMAHEVIKAGRVATGTKDISCTVSIGGFVPKPHTPFQWAPMERPEVIDNRLRMLKQEINSDRSLGRAIGYRYHDGEPSLIEGLLSRGDRRVGAVIRRAWEQGPAFRRLERALLVRPLGRGRGRDAARPSASTWTGSPPASASSSRSCPGTTSTRASTRTGSGRTGRTRKTEFEQDDCRWTPCFDCGVCPSMDTEIQIGPTGKKLLPLTPVTGLRVPEPTH